MYLFFKTTPPSIDLGVDATNLLAGIKFIFNSLETGDCGDKVRTDMNHPSNEETF